MLWHYMNCMAYAKKNLIYGMGVEINEQKHKPNGYSECEPEHTK